MYNICSITLKATPDKAYVLRRTIGLYLDLSGVAADESFKIVFAVNEAVSNSIRYAYISFPEPDIFKVNVARVDDQIETEIIDHGRWLAKPSLNGQGLVMMKRLSNSFEISSNGFGTRVKMKFNLKNSQVKEEIAVEEQEKMIKVNKDLEVPVISIIGDIDISNLEEFKTLVHDCADQNDLGIVVSMEQLRYFDSRTVQYLLEMSEKFKEESKAFIIVSPTNASAQKLINITSMNEAITMTDSVSKAIEIVKEFKK